MKIEKINERQIRCTLTREDLQTRGIRIAELAYGTDKARKLFSDMMAEANYEFGFDTDNCPLTIEAIPTSSESIILIITKVEDPEELDTRFSRFTKGSDDEDEARGKADDIVDLFNRIMEAGRKQPDGIAAPDSQKGQTPGNRPSASGAGTEKGGRRIDITAEFRFDDIDSVIRAARGLNHFYSGRNALYQHAGKYYLIVHQSGLTPGNFNKVCNILSEYGSAAACSKAGEAYLKEHGDVIIRSSAIQKLSEM